LKTKERALEKITPAGRRKAEDEMSAFPVSL
jgi:hypothetical protein